jgi:Tfp pilus assembly protein PilX
MMNTFLVKHRRPGCLCGSGFSPTSAARTPHVGINPDPQRQKGAALFIALVALLAMTFAGLALLRSMDTAGLIAGNFSFRQAALSVADIGLEGTLGALESTYIPAGRDTDQNCSSSATPPDVSKNCTYYAWHFDPNQAVTPHCTNDTSPATGTCDNANGVSQRIDWSQIPLNDVSFAALGTGFQYQYVIERLCDAGYAASNPTAPDIGPANIPQFCYSMDLASGGNSQEARSAQLGVVNASKEVAYRATIRVTGPHNASTMIQTIFMKN